MLITPREVAGVAAGLQEGLVRRGLEVDLLFRWAHPFAYGKQTERSFLHGLSWLVSLEHRSGRLPARFRSVASLAARVAVLPMLAARYGAVIFIGPDTLLRGGIDRALLRRVGVRTVTVFCGSDARPPYLNGYWVDPDDGEVDLDALRAATEKTRDRVRRAELQSDYVVNHPATAQFHQRPYLDWTVMGMPGPAFTLAEQAEAVENATDERAVRVLHAPSDPRRKGTAEIRAAIEALRADGMAIDYVEVTGQTHAVVQQRLHWCDLVVDELYSDALLAGLAMEAARLGKPALVFGYAGDLVRGLAERVGAPADHYARPNELPARLGHLIAEESERRRLGAALQRFVETSWAPEAITQRYERVLGGDPDPRWFDEPGDAAYVSGWGVPEHKLGPVLARYAARFGTAAFALSPGSKVALALEELLDRYKAEGGQH